MIILSDILEGKRFSRANLTRHCDTRGKREEPLAPGLSKPSCYLPEFVKLCGARALFRHFVILPVTKIVKFLGKIDDHPERKLLQKRFFRGAPDNFANSLAFDWRNYRFSCEFRNSIHNSATTSGGKQDYFPLWDEQTRARSEQDTIEDELPLLLDPANPIDVTLIAFADDGSVGPAFDEQKKMEYKMAVESIKRYHLNHSTLMERRALTLRVVRTWVEEADKLLARHAKDAQGFSRTTAKARMQDIMRAVSAKAIYSTAVKHLLAALAASKSDAARSVLKSL